MPYHWGPTGKIIAIATVNTAVYRMKIGLVVWWDFVTMVQLTFSKQPAKPYAINPGYRPYVISPWVRSSELGDKGPADAIATP